MKPDNLLSRFWRVLRQISGDDAYERYLAHWRTHHGHEDKAPLTRQEFFKLEVDRKWNGVRRCC
jgi:uncharacterized short protein YbdD (DUF466 family)